MLLGLFNSGPWVMLAALSVHLWIIGVLMKASRYPYAWFMAAFVPLVVWGDTYPHFENAFYFGTFRWLETTTGVMIFSMVELVFWPQTEGESAPTENDDGTLLEDLRGYKLYWGTSAGVYTDSATIDNPGITTYVVENLPAGTYEFVATAYNSAGVESVYSTPATKVLN